jgi:hypothetical protein
VEEALFMMSLLGSSRGETLDTLVIIKKKKKKEKKKKKKEKKNLLRLTQ